MNLINVLLFVSMYIAFGREADQTRTVVDQVFGGKLLSTVICSECGSVSQFCVDPLFLAVTYIHCTCT